MAFGCGFGLDGGFVDACAVPPLAGGGCGGGYGSAAYATVEYAGGSTCDSGGNPASEGSTVLTPTAGVHTYKLTLATTGGTVDLDATATIPAFILVEDIGPA